MRRRELIAGIAASAATWQLEARAQHGERVRRVGILMGGNRDDAEMEVRLEALQSGLKELGWIEGRNITLEYRWAGGDAQRFDRFSNELILMQPDVIFATTFAAAAALKERARTIPIVFVMVSDPVGAGIVTSLARPGGNLTGFTPFESSLGGKWIELLREIFPGLTRAMIVFNPDTARNAPPFIASAQTAGASLGVATVPTPVREISEIENIARTSTDHSGSALVIAPDAFLAGRYRSIVAIAANHRLPLISPFRFFTVAGALVSYGINIPSEYRRATGYINRILRGEDPALLPVQAPTKFELIINQTAARALGINVPPMLLARADEVIE